MIVDRHGTPLAATLTGGNRHDVTQLLPLLDAIPPIRGQRGRPRRKPRRLYADRGYDFDRYRRLLWKRGIKPMIARRGVPHGSGLGKVRWVVERAFAWLHQFKRLRVRYERRADIHHGLLALACSIICLRKLRFAARNGQQGRNSWEWSCAHWAKVRAGTPVTSSAVGAGSAAVGSTSSSACRSVSPPE